MTAYYNNLFKADPELFVNTYTVDIKTWFESLVRSLSPETRKSAALCEAANAMGACRADFEPVARCKIDKRAKEFALLRLVVHA